MNRQDIIRMAREQGLPETDTDGVFIVNTDDLGRILSAEREACANICETLELPDWPNKVRQPLAQAIRAREQA